MKQIKLLLALAFVNLTIAQHNTTAELTTVKADGLYEINIPNKIRSFSNRNLSDFRILDSKGKEAPYFIREKSNRFRTSEYIQFEIESKKTEKDTSSSIVIKNPFKTIQELVLSTANYSGTKTYKILGSNDKEKWFGVLNTGYLSNLNSVNSTSIDKTINFPRCNYMYIKIQFNNKNSLPINILKIGGYANSISNRELQKITATTITTKELVEQKKTQIHIQFKNKEVINQIQFKVAAPDFFNRNAIIYKKSKRVVKNKESLYNKTLERFLLNSNNENTFYISEIFEDDIYIEIENKDSNSLTFSDISFYQKPLYAIASLKENETYTITTGDNTKEAPEYDLSYFKNNISIDLPIASIKNITKQKEVKPVANEISFWQQSWFMWSCIALTGLIILFFTTSLVKDLKKE